MAISSIRVLSEESHLFCMLLKRALNACKGSLGIFGFFSPHSFHSMKLELLLNEISRADQSDVVLEIQVGAQDLTVPSSGAWLYLGRIPGGQVDAPHASDIFWQRQQWPKAPRAWRGFAGAHAQQMRCHSVYSHVLCTNCPLLALQSSWLQEAQQRLSKGCNESGSDVFPSQGNPLA